MGTSSTYIQTSVMLTLCAGCVSAGVGDQIQAKRPAFMEFVEDPDLVRRVEKEGFIIVDGNGDKDELYEYALRLGELQNNRSADDDGYPGIVRVENVRQAVDAHKVDGQVQNVSTKLNLHSDGSFLNGFCSFGSRVLRVRPPRFTLLQVVEQSEEGGENIFLDVRRHLSNASELAPFVEAYYAPVWTLLRETGTQTGNVALFETDSVSGALSAVRFRLDVILAPARAVPNAGGATYADAARALASSFNNSRFFQERRLKKNQILIVANRFVLHGRRSIVGNRLLRRAWVWDGELSGEFTPADDSPVSRGPDRFPVYQEHCKIDREAIMTAREGAL